MKIPSGASAEAVAALVCQALDNVGIKVTLTGGSCVSIWSDGKYVSDDLDFIEDGLVTRDQIRAVLKAAGFVEHGRHFSHPETKFFVEFPAGPLMVGREPVKRVVERKSSTGILRLLSATDCVKDRLAAFFYWNDKQALEQALLVAKAQRVNKSELRRWSQNENNLPKLQQFLRRLRQPKSQK